jgi:hypothetical protein
LLGVDSTGRRFDQPDLGALLNVPHAQSEELELPCGTQQRVVATRE